MLLRRPIGHFRLKNISVFCLEWWPPPPNTHPLFNVHKHLKINGEYFWSGKGFLEPLLWCYKDYGFETGSACFCFWKNLLATSVKLKDLTYPFVCVGKFYISSSGLGEKNSWEGSEATPWLLWLSLKRRERGEGNRRETEESASFWPEGSGQEEVGSEFSWTKIYLICLDVVLLGADTGNLACSLILMKSQETSTGRWPKGF